MMSPRRTFTIALIPSFALVAFLPAAGADPEPTTAALSDAIVRARSADSAAAAYRAYFLRGGRVGLKDLLKDEDTGISLQAAWETNLKPAKLDPRLERGTDVYDPDALDLFVRGVACHDLNTSTSTFPLRDRRLMR
jgi:hypothetical protein